MFRPVALTLEHMERRAHSLDEEAQRAKGEAFGAGPERAPASDLLNAGVYAL
jgi:hypothetical protein